MPAREATARDYRERINRVIFHIEAHLGESLILEDLAKVAFFSPYHFHRIFAAFAGEPLAAFIRRLRLERAAQQLLHLDAPVTEIALGAGYETAAAFTRAFSAHFAVSPTLYRERHTPATILGSKLLALTTEKEDSNMTPEIRNTEPIPVLFVRRMGPYYQAADEAFCVLCQFAGQRGLLGPTSRVIGISHDDPHVTDESKFRYDACVTIDREVEPEGEVGLKTIPGGKYAVFLHTGPFEGFAQTYDRIFKAWLPGSGERLREEPCFEVYLDSPEQVKPEDRRTEIWVPLQ
ncbi:MAG: AraC family transcriptional regulator [Myxococcota bacterium]|jgi:AraC family transcriptional regulator|nr:AraC family transcriptional regulator [Myxococcota bacterium]